MNEIKVGDIVRVSEDAPKMYKGEGPAPLLEVLDSKVIEIADGNALIEPDFREGYGKPLPIPTKYLVKVNAEPKYSEGDKALWKNRPIVIDKVEEDGNYIVKMYGNHYRLGEAEIAPYTEPKEPTERIRNMLESIERSQCEHFIRKISREDFLEESNTAEHKVVTEPRKADKIYGMSEETANILARALEAAQRNINDIANGAYWQSYTADLAKEIAVKITNKKMDNDPEEVGEYAVLVAKSVAENLKKRVE